MSEEQRQKAVQSLQMEAAARDMKQRQTSRDMKDDLREALRVEAFLRMLTYLQDLYIQVEELSGDDIRLQTKRLIRERIDRCRLELGMEKSPCEQSSG